MQEKFANRRMDSNNAEKKASIDLEAMLSVF
jgi:hypothetical protein